MNRAVFLILIFLVFITACNQKKDNIKIKQNKPTTVIVETVKVTDIPVIYETFGQVVSQNTINITSKVAGKIEKIYFKEGEMVKKGQLLAKIDCLPLEKSIQQAEAILKRDLTILENAKKNAKRYEELVQKGYAAKVDLDNALTAQNTAIATVDADKSNIEYLKAQLSYCSISSPIKGKIGEILVDQGNFIKENDKIITTIQQISPIDAEFSLPEEKLVDILRKIKENKKIRVDLLNQNNEKLEEGFISFIDNTIDRTTGAFKIKGAFKNSQEKLWPGQFVNIKVYLDNLKNVTIVPTKAIQKSQTTEFVWIILDNNTAITKKIYTIYSHKDVAVVKGVKEGERVVIDGAIKLKPNSIVEIKKMAKDETK